MTNNKLRVEILGRVFNLVSGTEEASYIAEVAEKVDAKMKELKRSNPQLSYEDAAVLSALNFCDDLTAMKLSAQQAQETEADSIRSQLVEYSKELSNATATIKKLQKEINQLKLGSQEKRTPREYAKHDKYDGATLQQ
mgnify:FL=1